MTTLSQTFGRQVIKQRFFDNFLTWSILFNSVKIIILAHSQHYLEAEAEKIQSLNDFLLPITLAANAELIVLLFSISISKSSQTFHDCLGTYSKMLKFVETAAKNFISINLITRNNFFF